MALKSKMKNLSKQYVPNLVKKLSSKLQVEILKNVGVAILVTEIK